MTAARGRAAVRLGALLLILQAVSIPVELAAGWASPIPYSFWHQTISDLGSTTCTSIAYPFGPVPVCSPLHTLVNGSFVFGGLGLVLGFLLVRSRLPRGRLTTATLALWVIAGLSSIASGLVPLDVDLELHAVVSTPLFLAQPVALLLLGAALRSRWAVAAGVVSLLASVAFFALSLQPLYGGLLERLALWPGLLWPAAFGALLLTRSGA